MSASAPPIVPGSKGLATFATIYIANLGRTWEYEGATWRLVKAGAALTTISSAALVTTLTAGLPSWAVNTSTTASDFNVVGVCAAVQEDLAIGDYFMIQVSGFCNVISAAAIAANVAVGCSTTAKKVDDATITLGGILGYSLESAAGVDELVGIQLVSR